MTPCVGSMNTPLYPHFESRQMLGPGTSPSVYIQHGKQGGFIMFLFSVHCYPFILFFCFVIVYINLVSDYNLIWNYLTSLSMSCFCSFLVIRLSRMKWIFQS